MPPLCWKYSRVANRGATPMPHKTSTTCRRASYTMIGTSPPKQYWLASVTVWASSVAAADDHVVGHHGCLQPGYDILHRPVPGFLAELFQAAQPDVILEGAVLFVRQVGQLQGDYHLVVNEGRAESGPQAEEQHVAA